MKLSCAIVLTLTNLVIATPFSFSVKGSGTPPKVDPASATFGTFGLVQPVGPKPGYSGTFSKSSSANFASSSASESSGSFSYNAAQGTPSGFYNTGAAFGVPGQVVGQNVAVTPQALPTAVPVVHNTGSSENTRAPVYYFSKDVSHISTPSKVQTENKPDISLGYNPHAFVSQDISKPSVFESTGSALDSGLTGSLSSEYGSSVPVVTKTASNLSPAGQKPGVYLGSTSQVSGTDSTKPNTLVSGSPAYTAVSDSSYKGIGGVQTNTDTAEKKPGDCLGNTQTSVPQGIAKPNVFISNIVSKLPEEIRQWSAVHADFSSTINGDAIISVPTNQEQVAPTVEEKPVYSSGFGGPPGVLSPYDKASVSSVAISGSNLNQYQQNAELGESVSSTPSSYTFQQQQQQQYEEPKPNVGHKPTITKENKHSSVPEVVKSTEKPYYENANYQSVNVGPSPASYVTVKPTGSVSYSKQDTSSFDVPSTAGTVGHISTESHWKGEEPTKPLYTGGFVAPAGGLQTIQGTVGEVHKYASSTFKPELYEESKPSVGYTTIITEVNKHITTTGEVKPTGPINYSEQDTSSFGTPSTAGTVGHISTEYDWKLEEPKKPLYTGGFGAPTGVLQPIQGTVGEVHKFASSTFKPELYEESKPSVGYKPTITEVNKHITTTGEVKPTGSVSYSEHDTSSFGVSSTAGTVGHISTEYDWKLEEPKKPLYTGGFGAPTGVLQPIQGTVGEIHKFASSTFKPELYEESKPSVGYKPTITEVNKHITTTGEVKPTGSVSYSEHDTSSFGVSSTAGTVGHISTEYDWKLEEPKKPLYTGGFGAPTGVLQPIQGTVGEVHKFASSTFKPNQYEESKPSVGDTPTITEVNKYITTTGQGTPTEKPNFENASYQSVNVGSSPGSYVTVKPTGSINNSEQDTSSFGVSSTAGGHISAESDWKVEEPKKPLYTGEFGAPAGVLQPISATVSEVQKYGSTTFKPEQYEETKPTVEYTPKITKVNKFSTTSGEVKLTQKPYSENTSYQSVNVASNPSSYVTLKPTGSISYSERDTSSFGVSSTHGTEGALEQKVEEQIVSKPYNSNPAKPTFSTWEQNPTQASIYFVQKPTPVEPVEPVKPVQIPSESKPIFSNSPQTYTTPQPPTYSYPLAGQNPSSPIPGGYKPSSVFVTKDESKPNSQVVTNQYESSQFGAVSNQEVEKQSYQAFPTGSTSISSSIASSYKPEQTSVPFDTTKPSSIVVITDQKETTSAKDVKVSSHVSEQSHEKVSSHLTEQSHEKETISPFLGAVNPTVPQNSAVHSNTGFVSVSQQPTNKPSFEKSSEKVPAYAFSGNPLTISHSPTPSISYVEQKETQKPNTYSDKIKAQVPKRPTVTNPDKPSYSSSFGTLTGSTGYKPSSYGQESTVVTGSNDKVSQVNLGTTVKPFVKPELPTLSQQAFSTSSVSQNADKQKHSDSTLVQNKPTVVTSEGQQFTNQAFTTNSGVASGATPFGSKLQYQLPTIQPAVQKNPWYTNSFGSFGTAKPYNSLYPGFTSSVTTYGQALSQDKTKQTTQITSPGQYVPFSSGQYKPYTTGQYKPYNWGFNGQPGYQKFSNIYPTGGTFVSTYAPTTYKPFVTSSLFDKSKTSSIFAVSDKKESTSLSGFGSPFSVTTAKPSLLTQTQTSYKPGQEPTVLGEYYVEKPKVNKVVVPPKPDTPLSKPSETQPKKSYLSLNSASVGISSIGQSSFSTIQPTANLPAPSAQSDIHSETTDTVSPTKVVDYNTNYESGVTAEVTKLPETSFAPPPVSQVNPSIQNKPYAGVDVGSFLVKPSTLSASQIKVDEKIQSSQPVKPDWSSDLDHKESSVGIGVTPDNLKPTEKPYLSSTTYFINKEVTPTQVSAIKPASYDTFITVSANKGDEKIQYSPTPRPEWSADSKQKEPSLVSLGEASESVKPTSQPSLATSSYSLNKEVTPTELSATKPSSYGTFIVDTSSQNKLNEKVEFSQTSTPGWSSLSNQKVTADSSKPYVQPSLGTNFYSINKVVTPTQVDGKKPSSFGTSNTGFPTTTTNVESVQSVVSSANEENSGVQLSSVEKWSVSPIPIVTHKPEYSSTFQQSSGHVSTLSPAVNTESDSAIVSISEITSKPIFETPKPGFAKPTAQISTVEKKPAVVVSYKEKDTNEASLVSTVFKPTVPSTPDVKVASKYTDGPAKIPASFIYSTQIPPKTNQQPLALNSNAGTSQTIQTSYVGGFGGPAGILKPNDFSSPPQQQYVQTQYKPSYNNQVAWANQQNPPSGVNSNTASYFGGFGSTSGAWTANENVKPNGFGYVQSVNKYTTNVQAQKKVNQDAVFESQGSVGGSSNAAVKPSSGGSVSNYEIQNPFNGGVSTGTGFTKNNYKLTGQFSGTKAFGTTQFRASATPGLYGSFL